MLLIAQAFFIANSFLNVLLLTSTSVTNSFKNYSAKGMSYLVVSVLENLFAKLQEIQFVSILPPTSFYWEEELMQIRHLLHM